MGCDAVHRPRQVRLVQQSTRVQDRRVGRTSQHPSDADPPHACPRQLAGSKRSGEHVDRFRCHGGNHGPDGDEVRQRRRVEAVRPALAKATRRLMVSSRSGRPCRKFSARAVRTKGCGAARAAATAARMRATAASKPWRGDAGSAVVSSTVQPHSPAAMACRTVSAQSSGWGRSRPPGRRRPAVPKPPRCRRRSPAPRHGNGRAAVRAAQHEGEPGRSGGNGRKA